MIERRRHGPSRRPWAAVLLIALSACSGLEPTAEVTRETIVVESVDLPGRLWDPFMPPLTDGTPVMIDGELTVPPTAEPVPAVIIAHGCGGVGGAERGWVDDLNDAGYAVLVLDSFGGRDISTICFGTETVNVASMLVDLYRSAETLGENPYVDGTRMAVVGFSFGGRTALWSAMTRFQDLYGGEGLAAHVAFYPSTCFIELEGESEVSPAPIRIFHGTEDDWTPIDQCQAYTERMATAGVDIALHPYPGAHHSFDNETLDSSGGTAEIDAPSPRNCHFAEVDGVILDPDTGRVAGVGSPCVELGVHYAYNRDAHRAAKADLLAFLHDVLDAEDG